MFINKFLKKIAVIQKQNKISVSYLQEGADFVDFILLNLEAGANIEKSFFQAVSHLESGLLKKQTQKIFTLCSIGFSFGEAINHILAEGHCDTVFKEILENLSLSLKLGSSLTQILNHLSFHFRLVAISRLEEMANEAPIKMIFPLVVFIFPIIFILLGAGAIESLVRSFSF